MNSIVRLTLAAALAVSAYPIWSANATSFKVTEREAGIETEIVLPGANKGIVPPSATPKAVTPAAAPQDGDKFVVVATVSVGGQPLMQMKYQKHDAFDDEDSCKAFLASGDEQLKKDNDGLAALAKVKLHPDAKVDVSCEPDSE